MRDPKRIDRILKLIRKIWKCHPDLRLAQLIGNCYIHGDNYHKEDSDVEFMLRSVYIREANESEKKSTKGRRPVSNKSRNEATG